MKTTPSKFASREALRAWLSQNHDQSSELWILVAKKHVASPKLTYPELVEELLCFGWVDGLTAKFDDDFQAVRTTPRKTGSLWSPPNVERVERMLAAGLMRPEGLIHVEQAKASGAWDAAVRRTDLTLADDIQAAFSSEGLRFFRSQTPGRQRRALEYIDQAKRSETRAARIAMLVTRMSSKEPLI